MNFTKFNLHPAILDAVVTQGYEIPTPIQEQGIPLVLAGKDVMGLAQTGTGKTAAFVLPILERLAKSKAKKIHALILAPTRELAEQINDVVSTLGKGLRVRSLSVYGGTSMGRQVQELRRGVDVVVGCPGRVLDHLQQGTMDLRGVEVLVLDEADQMFDMGFIPTIRQILKRLPKERQNLLFSATMPSDIRRLAEEVLKNPETVQVGTNSPATTVSHAIFPVSAGLKSALLVKLLEKTDTDSVLIFVRTKHRAKRLATELEGLKFKVAALQGNLSQSRRAAAMAGFRSGKYQILVATDIAARGVDISSISHVINFDIPDTAEAYTHRIGRTGRAAKTGDAFTLVTHEDAGMVRQIERALKAPLERRTLEDFDYKSQAPASALAGARDDDRRPRGNFSGRRRSSSSGNSSRRGNFSGGSSRGGDAYGSQGRRQASRSR